MAEICFLMRLSFMILIVSHLSETIVKNDTSEDIKELQETVERMEDRLNQTYLVAETLLSQFSSVTVSGLEAKNKTIDEIPKDSTSAMQNHGISDDLHAILKDLERLTNKVSALEKQCNKPTVNHPASCLEALREGQTKSGVVIVQPSLTEDTVKVYCDQMTDGGGWTVFQRRQDGSTNFSRNWRDYKDGFGPLTGEFWLGNEKIWNLLSGNESYELRIDLVDFNDSKAYAKYRTFAIGTEDENYNLTVDGYTGDAGNSLAALNGKPFSTAERDNDGWAASCTYFPWAFKGGFWNSRCMQASNLNGIYTTDAQSRRYQNIVWFRWRNYHPLKATEMKFREHM